jgi:hypothetical protein
MIEFLLLGHLLLKVVKVSLQKVAIFRVTLLCEYHLQQQLDSDSKLVLCGTYYRYRQNMDSEHQEWLFC